MSLYPYKVGGSLFRLGVSQELHCSVHSFAPRVEVLELVAHLTISTFSLSDIITDCLPSAKPSSIPPISREIV